MPGRIVSLLFLALISGPMFLATAAGVKPGATIFVALGGNDAWSGSLPAPNAAKTDGPLATLDRARDRIREMKKAGPLPAGGVAVVLRGGTYFLAHTFQLSQPDSGTADSPVVYRAAEAEQARLIGGRPVTGFVPYRDAILKAAVAAQGLKGVYFRQLFFDGHRQHLALAELRSTESLRWWVGLCRRPADQCVARNPQRKPSHVPVQRERRPELEPA